MPFSASFYTVSTHGDLIDAQPHPPSQRKAAVDPTGDNVLHDTASLKFTLSIVSPTASRIEPQIQTIQFKVGGRCTTVSWFYIASMISSPHIKSYRIEP
jgi:hypothetical protein